MYLYTRIKRMRGSSESGEQCYTGYTQVTQETLADLNVIYHV